MHQGPVFIVNPQAGRGRGQKAWGVVEAYLKAHNFKKIFTTGPGEATVLTRRYLKDGYTTVVAVGGDGTASECVNGFFAKDKPINPEAVLGILPVGRGSDLARCLGIPRDPLDAVQYLLKAKTRKIDVARLACVDFQGKNIVRYFINNAYIGLGTQVDEWSRRAPKFFGATGAYFYGLMMGALLYRPLQICYGSQNATYRKARIMNMVIGNGPYFGSGMKAAPNAIIDDGLLDLVVIKKDFLPIMLPLLSQLYSGKYLDQPFVEEGRDAQFYVYSPSCRYKIPIEADGDTVGYLPATFTLLKRSLGILCNS